jgi:predicted nucleic acid-binding Zn ribbon protein
MAKTKTRTSRSPTPELSRVIDDIERARGEQRYKPRARPKKIGDVVSQLLARRGYAQQAASTELADTWKRAVGEAVAGQTRVGAVRRGILEIVVANSAVSQELTFRKAQLLAELASRLPEHKITSIRFRTGNVES